jgi:hypothetical protein
VEEVQWVEGAGVLDLLFFSVGGPERRVCGQWETLEVGCLCLCSIWAGAASPRAGIGRLAAMRAEPVWLLPSVLILWYFVEVMKLFIIKLLLLFKSLLVFRL